MHSPTHWSKIPGDVQLGIFSIDLNVDVTLVTFETPAVFVTEPPDIHASIMNSLLMLFRSFNLDSKSRSAGSLQQFKTLQRVGGC